MDVKRELDDLGRQRLVISHPKLTSDVTIVKAENGYSAYIFKYPGKSVPEALKGWHTTPDKALKAFEKYMNTRPEAKTVRRDRTYKENHEPKLQPDGKEHL